jgi:hypothetical protein
MLGIGGKFASSKGMVLVPNLVGLSSIAASTALTNAGLRVGSISETSGSSSQDGSVASQGVASGILVDYETTVSFTKYKYTAPSGPSIYKTELDGTICGVVRSTIFPYTCSGTTKTTQYETSTYTRYKHYWTDGTTTTSEVFCSSTPGTHTETNAVDCGYAPPAVDCTRFVSSQNYTVNDIGCASGRAWYSVAQYDPSCNKADYVSSNNCFPVSQYDSCPCTPSCNPVWYGKCIGGTRQAAQRCYTCANCTDGTVSSWTEPC